MKKIYFLKYLTVLLISVAMSVAMQGQNFKLIDINKTKNSNPNNFIYSAKNKFADLNGVFYFQADDGVHGTELYKSDGTAKGTRLVKDILPGSASSYPYEIITSGGKLFFLANNTLNLQKLWISDGTDAGTQMLGVLPQGLYSYSQYLTDVNGTLYFNYIYQDSSFNTYTQIWKSDGTAPGTVLVASFYGSIQQLINVDGRLFFTAYDDNATTGLELYTSDGTAEGTKLVADINTSPYAGSNPIHLTALNGLLYFAADDGTGIKLWVSDGTTEGTYAVKNDHSIYLASGNGFLIDTFAIKNNTLYFQGYAFDSSALKTTGNELCKYNTTEPGSSVSLVKDINPGEGNSYPSFITNVNDTLYFTIGPDSADAELWKSDGTAAGTVLVKDINPGGINNYYGLTNAGGILLFAYGNDALGTELWKSNGTSTGTVLVKDILPGSSSSYPGYFTYKNGIFIFGANGPRGNELWRSDGTEAGTVMIKDINYKSTSSSNPYPFTATANNKIVFIAQDGKTPNSLFVTNGTETGTQPVGVPAANPRQLNNNVPTFVTFDNAAYFFDNFYHLWKTNGTKAGTSILPLPPFADVQNGSVTNFAATDSLLYIFTYNSIAGNTVLWRTDGSPAGTYVLANLGFYYYYLSPTTVGNILFFAGADSLGFSALWKTDGSVKGTGIVKVTGTQNPLINLYNFHGKLFFGAYTPTSYFGPSLWSSDGTEAGTRVFREVALYGQPFAQANGKLFFSALDKISNGYELFASDGTAAGTGLVKDIYKGAASSSVTSLVGADTLLYFLANDGIHGEELWKSNGTGAGTKLVKDIAPGVSSTFFNYAVNVHNNLFFTVNDTLWQSDGTRGNTHAVQDDNLKGVTQINSLAAFGDTLYFSGYTYVKGQELYIGSAEIKAPVVTLTTTDSVVTYSAPAKITLHAAATDAGGTITKVTFYNGETFLHNDYKYPYDFSWINVPVGNYTFTARATDNSGNISTSNSINVLVTDSETITAPSPKVSIIKSSLVSTNRERGINGSLSLKLSPDPADNILQISAKGLQQNRPSTITVISIAGITLKTMQSVNSSHVVKLDVSSLAGGVYTVKIICGDKVMYKQFVKL